MLLTSQSSTDRPSVTTTAWDRKGKLTFLFLCVLYLLNSVERGTLPATLYAQANTTKRMSIQATFGLTGTEVGSFESFFVAGLTLFLILWSALFKWLKRPFLVLALGYTVWLISCAGSAFSQEYTQFAISRFLCGAGDAAMNVLGVPWVDANVPSESRTRMVALFSMMLALGDAVGLILSAYVTSWSLNAYGWRTCYASIGLLTAPLILMGYFLDRVNPFDSLRGDPEDVALEDGKEPNRPLPFLRSVVQLLKNPLVVLAILGTAALQAMVASVGYYTNGYMIQQYNVPQSQAGVALGFTLLFSTFLGVPIGGIILDRVGRRRGGKTASLAFLQGSIFTFLGVILQLIGLLWADTFGSFLASLALAFIFFMIGAAAATPGVLWLVQPENRVVLSALVGFGFNILGKIPGPLVIGALLDSRHRHIPTRDELVYAPLWVLWCVVLWGLVAVLAARWEIGTRVDFEREDDPFQPKTTYESIE